MKLVAPYSPRFLIVLTLLTPYVFVLHYAISVLELIVWVFVFVVLLPTIAKFDFRLPRFLLVFLFLYTMGYLGALVNGMAWGVPIGIWNLNFFYKMLLGVGAFCIGMRYRGEIGELFRGGFILVMMIALGAIAIIYPFLSFETKVQYFGILYPEGSDFERYLTGRRMPGLGLNAVVYSFMLYTYLTFSFRAFLNSEIGFQVPLIIFLVILVLSSKLVIALSVATCALLVMRSSMRLLPTESRNGLHLMIGKRGVLVGITLLLILVAIVVAATQTTAGKRVVDSYATVQRFEAILSNQASDDEPTGFVLRFKYWKQGLDRAELAPFLGIGKDPFQRLSGTLAGFYYPHNEFLRMWLLYGLAGLAGWLYLLSYMTYKNVKYKSDVVWVIFYGALAVFMMFDGGLDAPRVNIFLMFILGLNWGQLRRTQPQRSRIVQSVAGRAPWVPST